MHIMVRASPAAHLCSRNDLFFKCCYMKQTFFVLIALFFIGVANAQDTKPQQEKVQATNRVHQVEHLLFITGKVYRSQKGQLTAIEEQVKLENGMMVNPNGSYQMPGQKMRRHLRDGECVDMTGNRYENLTQFDQNNMIKVREKKAKA